MPRRNQLCPCNSGKPFKRCHGAFTPEGAALRAQDEKQVAESLRQQQSGRQQFLQKHGAVREPIALEFKGMKAVAVGKSLHLVKAKVFPDFLNAYLAHQLWDEEAAWNAEKAKPLDVQHPAMQWQTCWQNDMSNAKPKSDGTVPTSLGGALAWFRLGYDLYLIEHNAELHRRLVERLRDPREFQGARFEVAIAGMMLAAGYGLRFAEDDGRAGARPEFLATHRETGHVLAVEAKSRHRPGVMQSVPGAVKRKPAQCQVAGLIASALGKNPMEPLLVFIEVNVPTLQADATPYLEEIQRSWDQAQADSVPAKFPAIGAFFYNDVSPWYASETVPDGANIWTLGLLSENRHGVDARRIFQRIAVGIGQRSTALEQFPE